jgi:hypothetical protein
MRRLAVLLMLAACGGHPPDAAPKRWTAAQQEDCRQGCEVPRLACADDCADNICRATDCDDALRESVREGCLQDCGGIRTCQLGCQRACEDYCNGATACLDDCR